MPMMKLPAVINLSPDAILKRFPDADLDKLHDLRSDKHRLIAYLAETHHLTMTEATEEVRDWLHVQTLQHDWAEQTDAPIQTAAE